MDNEHEDEVTWPIDDGDDDDRGEGPSRPYGTCAYDLSDDDLPEPQNIFCKRDFVEREYMHIDPCTVY
jgi:hypothetical protein